MLAIPDRAIRFFVESAVNRWFLAFNCGREIDVREGFGEADLRLFTGEGGLAKRTLDFFVEADGV